MPVHLIESYQKTYSRLPNIIQFFLDELDTSLTTRFEYAQTLEQLIDFLYLKYPQQRLSSIFICSLKQSDYTDFISLTQTYYISNGLNIIDSATYIQKNRKINIVNHFLFFLFNLSIHKEQIFLTNALSKYSIEADDSLTQPERITFWQAVLAAEPPNEHQSAYDKLIRQRNLLIILLSLTMGITAKEITTIKRTDISIDSYEVTIPRGKNKLEVIPIPHRYRDYFQTYWELFKNSSSSHLLHCINGELLTTNKIEQILTEVRFRSGFPRQINTSLLNHTFETMMMAELNNQKAVDWAIGKNDDPSVEPKKVTLEIKLIDLENL
ncbi:tyrosine-type recombinase/integrase [Vagococcus zengguangii]|uniref:Site-specific integrase n=1 Tax=Vagococcus zengguangii TaxID=2571750 RepID=A0A4D7CTC2_9ENTE|nr:site-specific integrase [Vagococcus zengguangii]QCI86072.1 site-specific integrase [Vagococcus zengguangii]TLG80185.1 site-specific integrase [Vagococcus zengguangii]